MKSYGEAFAADKCNGCGACLKGCPYQGMGIKEAKEGIRRLIDGTDVDVYLDSCVICGKCNHRCPTAANPLALILERFRGRRDKEKRTPRPLVYLMNGVCGGAEEKNFFTDIYRAHNKEEKRIIEQWSLPKEGEDLFFCGCMARISPKDVEQSAVLSALPKFGGPLDCCGVYAAKSGLYDRAEANAKDMIARLSQSRFKRLVLPCGTCQEVFTHIYPQYLGIEFPFEVISIYEYLQEKLQRGELRIQRKWDLDAALADSCFGYELGDQYLHTIGQLCADVGIKTTELFHKGKSNACCGTNGFLRKGRPLDIIDAGRLRGQDIRQAGKKDIVTYCQGCFLALYALQFRRRTHYLLEKILWSLGDEPRPAKAMIGKMINPYSISSFIRVMASG